MSHTLTSGTAVVIPWGADEVRGTVVEVYGENDNLRVVVVLTPEESGYVVAEPTTFAFPVALIRPVTAAKA